MQTCSIIDKIKGFSRKKTDYLNYHQGLCHAVDPTESERVANIHLDNSIQHRVSVVRILFICLLSLHVVFNVFNIFTACTVYFNPHSKSIPHNTGQ